MSDIESLFDQKRTAGYAEAERWARMFLDECRMSDCPHTAAEHYEARLFLSMKFLKLQEEHRLLRDYREGRRKDESYSDGDYKAVASNIADDPRWANRTDAQLVARWALRMEDAFSTARAESERLRKERDAMLADIHPGRSALVDSLRGQATAADNDRDAAIAETEQLRAKLATAERERDELRESWKRVCAVLSDEGCNCDDGVDAEERYGAEPMDPDDIEPCLGHRIEHAWRTKGDASK